MARAVGRSVVRAYGPILLTELLVELGIEGYLAYLQSLDAQTEQEVQDLLLQRARGRSRRSRVEFELEQPQDGKRQDNYILIQVKQELGSCATKEDICEKLYELLKKAPDSRTKKAIEQALKFAGCKNKSKREELY